MVWVILWMSTLNKLETFFFFCFVKRVISYILTYIECKYKAGKSGTGLTQGVVRCPWGEGIYT